MSLFKLVRSACIVGVALAVVAMLSLAVPSGSASAGFPGFPPVKTGTSLSFTGATITKAQTTAWAKDAGLEAFSLVNGVLEAGALSELVKSPTLARLELKKSRFVHSELRAVLEQGRIRHLSLEGCSIAEIPVNEGDKTWPMDVLDLSGTQVGSTEPTFLAKLTNLSTLNLANTSIGEAVLPLLAKYNLLRGLDISGTSVGNFSKQGPPRSLTSLSCAGLKLTPACIAKVVGECPGLVTLDLTNVPISDATLVQLTRLKKAALINVVGTGASKDAVDALAKALPTCVVMSDHQSTKAGIDPVATGEDTADSELRKGQDDTYLGPRGESGPKKANAERIEAALQWLADHQNSGGHWSAKDFESDSLRTSRPTPAAVTYNVDFRDDIAKMWGNGDLDKGIGAFDVGVTSLALLAFLADGHTPIHGRFSPTVSAAYKYLMGTQNDDGCYGSSTTEEFVYYHGLCTAALAELHLMWPNAALKSSVQKAVDFIVSAQNPGLGWRYGVRTGKNDTSVTSLMVHALKSAQSAGLTFDKKSVYAGANAWLAVVEGKSEDGQPTVGYDRRGGSNSRFPQALQYEINRTMDACSIACKLATGAKTSSDRGLANHAQVIARNTTQWYIENDESKGPWKIDMYYWYWASLALFQMGDSSWKAWEKGLMAPVLLKYQRGWHSKDVAKFGAGVLSPAYKSDGSVNSDAGRWILDEHGSWDPVDPWGMAGGRVYSTAINVLTLSVPHRFQRYSEKKKTSGAVTRPVNVPEAQPPKE